MDRAAAGARAARGGVRQQQGRRQQQHDRQGWRRACHRHRLQGDRPVGRRPVRRGEAAAEDRPDDRLRVAGALARRTRPPRSRRRPRRSTPAAAPTASCIEVTTCDDGANPDQAVACVRTIDEAGVVATVNDQGTAGQAEVSKAMAAAEIPRIAVERDQRGLGRPERLPDRRVRHRRHVPAAPGAHRRRTSTRSASSGSTWPRPPRSRASSRTSTRATAHVPLRHPGARRHHRLQPVHPRRRRTPAPAA